MQGLISDFLSFRGHDYSSENLWVELKHFQHPHPHFWIVESPIKVASMGSNLITKETIQDLPSTMKKPSEL